MKPSNDNGSPVEQLSLGALLDLASEIETLSNGDERFFSSPEIIEAFEVLYLAVWEAVYPDMDAWR